MSWLTDYRADIQRYKEFDDLSGTREILSQQGLWALLQYRIARALYLSRLPSNVRNPLLAAMYAWRKIVEVATGICLPYTADLGPGLYVAHFGQIIVNKRTVMGVHCTIAQGVTIGVSGRGERRGVPTIGNNVYIGPSATVAGKITVGDNAMISANSLVLADVPPGAVVRGVPAVAVGERD
jgi:serine O-acetyltransferase